MSDLTKAVIWGLFYGREQVVRKGGGKPKLKIRRKTISMEQLKKYEQMASQITDAKTVSYYQKIRDRNPNMSPLDCPKMHG